MCHPWGANGARRTWQLLMFVGLACVSDGEPSQGADQKEGTHAKSGTSEERPEKKRDASGVRLLISTNRTKFGPGEPIIVEVSTKNSGKAPFWIDVTRLSEDVRFTITTHDGTEVPLTWKGKTTVVRPGVSLLQGGPKHTYKIDPGESLELKLKHAEHSVFEAKSLVLNRYYDMTFDGKYKIVATRTIRVAGVQKKVVKVKSNTIEIWIDPQYSNPCCREKPKEVEPKPRALLQKK